MEVVLGMGVNCQEIIEIVVYLYSKLIVWKS